MKIYTIIGGVNGVGKSSFTGILKSQTTDLGMIVDIDEITADLGGNSQESSRRAHHIIENCIQDGVSFAQETTLSDYYTNAAARKAKDAGYYIRLYYIGLDTAEESKRRIANRAAKGGHSIAPEDVEQSFLDRWTAVQSVLPYCDEAVFYDNDNGFVEVAEYCNGELILKSEQYPRWIMELSARLLASKVFRGEWLALDSKMSEMIKELSDQAEQIASHRNRKSISKKNHLFTWIEELLTRVIENLAYQRFEPMSDKTLRVKWKEELVAHQNDTTEQDMEGYMYRNEMSALENELIIKVLLASLKKLSEQDVEGSTHRSIEMSPEKNHRLKQITE